MGSGVVHMPMATNCEAPANTAALMNQISASGRPRSAASASQTTPIGTQAVTTGETVKQRPCPDGIPAKRRYPQVS